MKERFSDDELLSFVTQPDLRADPYPFFHRLRSVDPIHRTVLGACVITRYDAAMTVLRHPAASSDEGNSDVVREAPSGGTVGGAFGRMKDRFLLMNDAPDHVRLRGIVSKAFCRSTVEGLRARTQDVAERLLDAVTRRRHMDLISDFAYPLSLSVICDLLGVPADDRRLVWQWARHLAAGMEILPFRSPEASRRADQATEAFLEYLRVLIARHRAVSRSELLSGLVQAQDGEWITEEESLATCLLLLVAGHETTANLIGNGCLTLLKHPEELNHLRLDRTGSVMKSAIEELLRFESPVQLIQRIAIDAIDVGEATIPKGGVAIVLIGAANRDPEEFAAPDRLDLARVPNRHLAFSGGPHACLGAALARLEGEIALSALISRLPNLAIAEVPEWREAIVFRGLKRLQLTW